MTKFKMGDLVQLTVPLTMPVLTIRPNMVYVKQLDTPVESVYSRLNMPVGTVLVVLSNNELAGQLTVAPVNDEYVAILEEVGSNSFKIDSTYVEAASAAARVLYGK